MHWRELREHFFPADTRIALEELDYVSGWQRVWLNGKGTMALSFLWALFALAVPTQAKALIDTIQSLYSMQAVLLLEAMGMFFGLLAIGAQRIWGFGPMAREIANFLLSSAFDQASLVEGAFIGMLIPAAISMGMAKGVIETLVILSLLVWFQHMTVFAARLKEFDLNGVPLKWKLAFWLGLAAYAVAVFYAFTQDKAFHNQC